MIAGKTRESARGSTAKTDGRSILIPWLAIAAGGLGEGDALAVCVSDEFEFESEGLTEAVALSVGVGDSVTVEVSDVVVVVVVVSDVGAAAVITEPLSSASTGAPIVTNNPVTSNAPRRLAMKDGL